MRVTRSAIRGCVTTSVALMFWGYFFAAPATAAEQQYIVSDLGTLGRPASRAQGINDVGQVAVTALGPSSAAQMFISLNGIASPVVQPTNECYVQAINDSGAIVGRAFGLPTMSPASFINLNGSVTVLPSTHPAGNRPVMALAINNAGDVTGGAIDSSLRERAFLYRAGVMNNLGVITGNSGDSSQGVSINNQGVIAGTTDINGFASQPFIYSNGSMTSFGEPHWSATDINDLEQIIGTTRETLSSNGFYFDGATIHLMSSFGGSRCDPFSINNSGVVVGRSQLPDNSAHAFRYTVGEGPIDLNTLCGQLPANLVLTEATGINNLGQIAANGRLNGVERAYLLTPVPEPLTPGIIASATVLTLARRCRRQAVVC